MLKVLFLIHDLGPGGAEKVLVNLVNNLDRNKFDITVLSLFGGGVNEQYLSDKIRYKTVFSHNIPGNSKIMKLFSPSLLHRAFIRETYDIEISYLEGPSARIISGCPNPESSLITWIHVEQHTKQIASQAFRSYNESYDCYKKFKKIVAVSESVKMDFRSIYPLLTDIDVIYNTNETDQILEKKDEPVEKELFKDDEIKLCGVGKLMPIKGFDKLARIHNRLVHDGLPVHTYVLGVGPEQDKLEKYIKDEGLENTFTLLGYQTNPYRYVSKCDVFICASTAEGFSTAATEALIVGTPVVTTPVAGMEEMLGKNNEYGLISEMTEDSLYETVKNLITNPALIKHYKKQAEIRGKYFSKENTVKAVEDYIESICRFKDE